MTIKYAEILLPRKMTGDKDTLTYQVPEELLDSIKPGQLVEIPLRKASLRGVVMEIHEIKPLFPTKEIIKKIDDFYELTDTQLKLLKFISKRHFSPLFQTIKLFYSTNIFSRKRNTEVPEPKFDKHEPPKKFTLSPDQKAAMQEINKNPDKPILLHGVTSSGKTEIYRRLTDEMINKDKQTLIMVPEISLTPQTVRQFQTQFGKNIAIIHSKLTPKEKTEYLTNIARGHHHIVVGSRSAIFAPFNNLGLIIIDEEHEDSYKQDNSPRYHAREIALKIKEVEVENNNNIQIILGSATPSIETYYKAKLGEYVLIEMTERIPHKNGHKTLPQIHLVDLREELKKKNFSIFSDLLQEKIALNLKNKEQTILFLNRRGSASAVICRDCGHTEECPNCSVALTYHSKMVLEESILPAQRLICHHCGRIFKMPQTCNNCSSHLIKHVGLGTQKIEEELQKLFPAAQILRADRDTTQNKTGFEHIYKEFRNNKADILIGTQMIGKGLHLPNVTLVGVVLADTGLGIPDFRSAEKTFQLLVQVAGRSGREKPGEVIIQSYMPEHYAIQSTLQHDFLNFYTQEIGHREKGKLPPFEKIIKITVENSDQEKAYYISHQLFTNLQIYREKHANDISSINVFPAFITKLKNKYRWQILISGKSPYAFLENFFLQNKSFNDIKIDVDPVRTI